MTMLQASGVWCHFIKLKASRILRDETQPLFFFFNLAVLLSGGLLKLKVNNNNNKKVNGMIKKLEWLACSYVQKNLSCNRECIIKMDIGLILLFNVFTYDMVVFRTYRIRSDSRLTGMRFLCRGSPWILHQFCI